MAATRPSGGWRHRPQDRPRSRRDARVEAPSPARISTSSPPTGGYGTGPTHTSTATSASAATAPWSSCSGTCWAASGRAGAPSRTGRRWHHLGATRAALRGGRCTRRRGGGARRWRAFPRLRRRRLADELARDARHHLGWRGRELNVTYSDESMATCGDTLRCPPRRPRLRTGYLTARGARRYRASAVPS